MNNSWVVNTHSFTATIQPGCLSYQAESSFHQVRKTQLDCGFSTLQKVALWWSDAVQAQPSSSFNVT